jgi:hypothetical protein
MPGNRCVVYVQPGEVSVETIDYPKLELPDGVPGRNRKAEHGVILRVVATNICGSDQHMVRGRTNCTKSSRSPTATPQTSRRGLQDKGNFTGEGIADGLIIREEDSEGSIYYAAILILAGFFPGAVAYDRFISNDISIKSTY